MPEHNQQTDKADVLGGKLEDSHKGRGQDRHGVPAMHQAQGGSDQGVEGPLEGLVAHARAAKGDAADISLRVLQRGPSCTCTPV